MIYFHTATENTVGTEQKIGICRISNRINQMKMIKRLKWKENDSLTVVSVNNIYWVWSQMLNVD